VLATKRPQLSFEPLFHEPLDFVCPADHPLAKSRRALKWAQIEGESFIRNGAAAALGIAEIEALAAGSKLTATNVTSNLAMVEAGLGVTILPRLCRWKSSHAVRFVPLADPRSSRTVGWIAKEGRNLQPAARRFVDCIRQQTQASEEEFGYAAA
jgi:DNA-binding transcriptional LysR family regulator